MKKYIYGLFAIVLISSQSIIAAGYLATYSVKVSNPAAYVEAMDELMETDWGKSFPAVVSIHQYDFNGYDDATHVVVLNYEDTASLGAGTESFSNPVFQSFLAKTSSIAEPIEQSLNMKLMGEEIKILKIIRFIQFIECKFLTLQLMQKSIQNLLKLKRMLEISLEAMVFVSKLEEV